MTTTEQNTNWARLTPEFRAQVKALFVECRNNLHVASLCAKAELLKELFGLNNLISTIEPEEMLMVEKYHQISETINEAIAQTAAIIETSSVCRDVRRASRLILILSSEI